MTISSALIVSPDKMMQCMKGVGAEGDYVKNRFRHDKIRFIVLSYRLVRRAIGYLFDESFDDSLP